MDEVTLTLGFVVHSSLGIVVVAVVVAVVIIRLISRLIIINCAGPISKYKKYTAVAFNLFVRRRIATPPLSPTPTKN